MNTLRLAMAALRNFLIGSAVIAFLFIFLCMPSADLVEVIRAVAWPLAAVAIVLLFAVHPRLNRIFGMTRAIRKLKAAGVEMEINAEVVDQVRSQLNESFDKLVRNAKDEYDQMSRAMRIPAHLQSIMTKCVTRELRCREFPTSPAGLRGTIHVQDIVFSEYLYQLTEYYPKRGGAGRRFSIRYGVIGRSWRLGESIGESNAFEEGKGEEQILIEHWGMTREEVAGRGYNSPAYLSIMLRGVEEDSYPIGILYIDSSVVGAFGNDKVACEIASAIERSEDVKLLSKALEKALTPLRLAAPDMDIGHRVGQLK